MNPPDRVAQAQQAAVEEITRQYPGAVVTWDLRMEPYMIVITVGRSTVRGFIELKELEERGRMYEALLRRLSEQITDSQHYIDLLSGARDEKRAVRGSPRR